MNKIIIFTMLLIIATTSFSQQTNPSSGFTKQDYLQKSKKQKTVAWILLGGGIGLIAITAAIPSEVTDYGNPLDPFDDKYSNSWDLLAIPGALGILGSIPFFIAAGNNKKKARSASAFINMEKVPVLQQTMIRNQSFPAVGVRISL